MTKETDQGKNLGVVKDSGGTPGESLDKSQEEPPDKNNEFTMKRLQNEQIIDDLDTQRKEKDALSKLKALMGKADIGFTVTVERIRPVYAKGLLEEHMFDTLRPISWVDIKDSCGGGTFKIMLHKRDGTIAGYTYIDIYGAPMDQGIIIPDPNVKQQKEDKQADFVSMANMIQQFMTPVINQQNEMIKTITENQQKDPVPVQQGLDLSQMTGMMKMFRSVMDMAQDLIPDSGGGPAMIDPENPLMNILAPLLTKLLEGKRPSQALQPPPLQQPPPPQQPTPPQQPQPPRARAAPPPPPRISNEQLLALMAERFRGPEGQKTLMDILSQGGPPPPPPGEGDSPGLDPDPPTPPTPPNAIKKPKVPQEKKTVKTPTKSKPVKKKGDAK